MALTRITKGVIKPNENYDTHDINSTGIITATGLNVSGNASIGGVLTYEDVTNIDSIGIITARSDIKVGTGVTLTSAGAGFYAGIVTASSFKLPDGSNVGGVESDSDQNTVGGTGAGQNLTGSSDQNTLFGYEAGNDIVSGDYNTLIGHKAGEYLYAGDENTAVGKNALAFEYNGDYNVAIGYNSLLSARATNHNTVLGRKSGVFLSSGDENILLGSGAGGSTTSSESLTSGSNNIIIGFEALPSATTVSNEITLGNANNNHLRIPGIGVSFSTNGNHISGVTTFTGEIHGDGQRLGSLTNSKRFSGLFLTNGSSYYGTNKLFVADGNGFGLDAYGSNDSWLKANSGGGTAGDCWMKTGGSGGHIIAKGAGAVELHHAGQSDKKLETTSGGVNVTGSLTVNGSAIGGGVTVEDEGTALSTDASALNFTGSYVTATGTGATKTISIYAHSVGSLTRGGTSAGTAGNGSTFFGYHAGKNATANAHGDRNTAFGSEALKLGSNWGGNNNVAVGWYALYQARGNSNTAVGTGACQFIENGDANTCIGSGAGKFLTSGGENTFIGAGAGQDVTTGTDNVTLGRNAGNSGTNDITTGSNNILIGHDAAASAATVSNEVTIGDTNITKFRIPGINVVLKDNGGTPTQGHVLTVDANGEASFVAASGGGGGSVSSDSAENTVGGSDAGLNLNTSSSYRNTLFGYQAGEQINSGDDNTIIGWTAGDNITSGYKNCAVGSEALPNCSSGHNNVAMGWEAARSLTSGNNNVCLGPMAGRSLGGGTYNVALGYHALSNTGDPTRCIGIGGDSIFLGGTDVIGIGQGTMQKGNSQIGGIGIGRYAGRNNAGDHNVYIGYEAGKGTSSSPYSTGEYNISLGYRSLYNITTGNKNIALGSEAGDVLTTGSNNIIIGDSADASSATVSNEITIGDANITKFRIPGLNSFEISDAGVLSGTASAATSANGFRNVTVSTASPSGGSDGDVWIKYS